MLKPPSKIPLFIGSLSIVGVKKLKQNFDEQSLLCDCLFVSKRLVRKYM